MSQAATVVGVDALWSCKEAIFLAWSCKGAIFVTVWTCEGVIFNV